MTRVIILMAVVVAFATSANTVLLAADTNAPASLHHSKIIVQHNALFGYFNPARSGEYDPYPYYNIIAGETYGGLYTNSLPDQYESPFNPPAALTWHKVSVPHRKTSIGRPAPAP